MFFKKKKTGLKLLNIKRQLYRLPHAFLTLFLTQEKQKCYLTFLQIKSHEKEKPILLHTYYIKWKNIVKEALQLWMRMR